MWVLSGDVQILSLGHMAEDLKRFACSDRCSDGYHKQSSRAHTGDLRDPSGWFSSTCSAVLTMVMDIVGMIIGFSYWYWFASCPTGKTGPPGSGVLSRNDSFSPAKTFFMTKRNREKNGKIYWKHKVKGFWYWRFGKVMVFGDVFLIMLYFIYFQLTKCVQRYINA